MPRIARAVAGGFPHHVVQRGNNREKVFFDTEGFALNLLKQNKSCKLGVKNKRLKAAYDDNYRASILNLQLFIIVRSP